MLQVLTTVTEKILKQGQGWRLGWNPGALEFQGLVGGEDWAIELTAQEFQDFCRLVQELATTMTEMTSLLMAEERISCESESASLWLEAEGLPQAYGLHLILNQGRRAEGYWPPEAVPELLAAIQTLDWSPQPQKH